MTTNDLIDFHRAVARVVAFAHGCRAEDVWPDYRTFEDDNGILVGVLEYLGDNAKPFLEMRERAREPLGDAQRSRRGRVRVVSTRGVVTGGSSEVGLDDQRPEEIESDSRGRR